MLMKHHQTSCLFAKVTFNKKRPLAGSLQTVVRTGEAPPDGQSIKIQSRFWSKIDFFQKSRKSSNEYGKLKLWPN